MIYTYHTAPGLIAIAISRIGWKIGNYCKH